MSLIKLECFHSPDLMVCLLINLILGNQVKVLKETYHTYLTDNGRISMAGLNSKNVKRFAQSVDWVVRNVN
jgi:hypothetical protein